MMRVCHTQHPGGGALDDAGGVRVVGRPAGAADLPCQRRALNATSGRRSRRRRPVAGGPRPAHLSLRAAPPGPQAEEAGGWRPWRRWDHRLWATAARARLFNLLLWLGLTRMLAFCSKQGRGVWGHLPPCVVTEVEARRSAQLARLRAEGDLARRLQEADKAAPLPTKPTPPHPPTPLEPFEP